MDVKIEDDKVLAEIVLDSINDYTGTRITTFILPRMPKCLLAEFNTHRMFSRNAASSRAIPLAKMIESVMKDPYIPRWSKRDKGMGGPLITDKTTILQLDQNWQLAMNRAIEMAKMIEAGGAAKENSNRLLEPFMRVPVIVTATEWSNFFDLRVDAYDPVTGKGPQFDFHVIAKTMQMLLKSSKPQRLRAGEWHIPMVTAKERSLYRPEVVLMISTARCARVSYLNHLGGNDVESDIKLHDDLKRNGHWSPFEHAASSVMDKRFCANLRSFESYRFGLEVKSKIALDID